jgi:trans-2-enoyl-CoA reductase
MARRYYSKRHYERVSPRQDTAEQIAERVRHREACEQAHRECLERWPELTPENVREALDWQNARLAELLRR